MIKHATIIPLIGGLQIGQDLAFGSRPEFLLSYSGFAGNEQHLLNWYNNEVPYYHLDKGGFVKEDHSRVQVIGSVCPCAGLSQLSSSHGTHNPNNEWLITATKYVLGDYKPEVFWGENAPGFAGKIGKDIREQMRDIGREHGYTMSVYRTKSLLHANPQVRERAFFFFWKGDKTPLLGYFNRPRVKIEDMIRGVTSNFQTDPINKSKPSDDPFYRFILDEMYGGIDHRTFSNEKMDFKGTGNVDIQSYIEHKGYNYKTVGDWMAAKGYAKDAKRCYYKFDKLASGGQIMRRGVMVPHDYIGAFVSHYPLMLTHPDEDRFINYREAMTIMGLPESFELLGGRKNVNHICQNVPVYTAKDMADEIKEVLLGNREYVDAKYVFQYNHSQTHELFDENKNDVTAFFS